MSGAHAAYTVERARVLRGALGENVRGLRKSRCLAQEALGEVASLHRNEIGIVERGECEPGLLVLLVIADALKVPSCVLLDGLPVPRECRPRRR